MLFPSQRQVTHALLTRPPLNLIKIIPKKSIKEVPFDLHVLVTPPAFVLSQEPTLNKMVSKEPRLFKSFIELFVIACKTFYPYFL